MPKIMVEVLAMESTKKLNYFPPKNGLSPYFSPHSIVNGTPIDYHKHCGIPFGTYCQAHDESQPKNSQLPRTIDTVYLRPIYNMQGGHQLLNLLTKKIITRRNVTPLPLSQVIINTVEKMAQDDNMKGLNLRTQTGHILYDSSWIAGVDYDESEDSDDESTTDDHENNDDDDDDDDDDDNNNEENYEDFENYQFQHEEDENYEEDAKSEENSQSFWSKSIPTPTDHTSLKRMGRRFFTSGY